jgi:hypothetical protein
MVNEPPHLDLLVVGSLTIDRFADGRLAPGGSVLHASLAAADAGYRVGVVTVAGPEVEARSGIERLTELPLLDASLSTATLTFRHEETPDGRRLWLEAPATHLARVEAIGHPAAVLFAPVADELAPTSLGRHAGVAATGAILQGWLRTLVTGSVVAPRGLDELSDALVAGLAACNVLVASREDLVAVAGDPRGQLDALRRRFGPGPTLVVTDGTEGAWVDAPGRRELVPAPRVIRDVPMVGAGDAYAALMLGALGRGRDPWGAARDAASGVAELLAARADRAVYVVGDLHGMREAFVSLLAGAGLVDASGSWTGGRDEVWCLGDLVDRGPDGTGIVELLMRLEAEAGVAGGRVGTVIGNHEVLLLAARDMPDAASGGPGGTFESDWLANGGIPSDLARLTDDQAAWLAARPGLARVADALLVHADAGVYLPLGRTMGQANETLTAILAEPDPVTWDGLLGAFTERYAYRDDPGLVARMLARFGGRRLLHGHTPVARLSGEPAATVRSPFAYAEGRCLALDPGLPLGGPGFLYRLEESRA